MQKKQLLSRPKRASNSWSP